MSKLEKVITHLIGWQQAQQGHKSGRCLEAVRAALTREGLRLPGPFPRPSNTALCCLRALETEPVKWGWRKWAHQDHPGLNLPLALVFFRSCGRLPGGRIAGHIAVYRPATGSHYSNQTHVFTDWWAQRLAGAFIPDV